MCGFSTWNFEAGTEILYGRINKHTFVLPFLLLLHYGGPFNQARSQVGTQNGRAGEEVVYQIDLTRPEGPSFVDVRSEKVNEE
jgi:hypothetical protein